MKQRRSAHKFLTGALTVVLATGLLTSAGAALTGKTIQVLTGSEIYIDGVKLEPTDANGNPVETFVYNGTTYVPLRAVSQNLGKAVSWDGQNQRVYIGEVPGMKQYLNTVCPAYQTTAWINFPTTFSMASQKYANGMTCYLEGSALYNLNGQYETLSFDVGHVDGQGTGEGSVTIELDGIVAFSMDLNAEMLPKHVTIPLNHALQMKISFDHRYAGDVYGLGEMVIE